MEKKKLLEAILFSSSEFLEKKKVAKYLRVSLEELERMISEINEELQERPYRVLSSGDRIKMALRPEYYDVVKPFLKPLLSEEELMVVSLFTYSDKIEARKLLRLLGGKYARITSKMIEKGILEAKVEEGRKYFVKGPKFSEYVVEGELREQVF